MGSLAPISTAAINGVADSAVPNNADTIRRQLLRQEQCSVASFFPNGDGNFPNDQQGRTLGGEFLSARCPTLDAPPLEAETVATGDISSLSAG